MTRDNFRTTTARCQRTARVCRGISSLLLPPAFGLIGASAYAIAQEPTRLPSTWLLVSTIAMVAAGALSCLGEAAASPFPRWLAKRHVADALDIDIPLDGPKRFGSRR